MDIAKKFRPHTILLWQKVANHPRAKQILDSFPTAKVKLIKHQRLPSQKGLTSGEALREGKRTLMIGETTSFVGHFDGGLGSSVRCCPYYKLVPLSNGCPYYCTYCYLGFVYRTYSPFIKLNINYETMLRQIRKTAKSSASHADFNMGEMLDSLALDHITGLTTELIPFFSELPNAYLMLLTKSSNIDNLLKLRSDNHIVVSWSLNSSHAIAKYEPGTANLSERINAARLCQQHGYRIRYRIDPGILHSNWQQEYAQLIENAFGLTKPENITLGMLRLLRGHKKLAAEAYGDRGRKLANEKLIVRYSDDKFRYHPKQRLQFYELLIDVIRGIDKNVSISLCRETPDIWQRLKHICQPKKCNCLTW